MAETEPQKVCSGCFVNCWCDQFVLHPVYERSLACSGSEGKALLSLPCLEGCVPTNETIPDWCLFAAQTRCNESAVMFGCLLSTAQK
jgi:hypothetical protein